MAMRRKDHPVGSPGKSKRGKHDEEDDDGNELATIEDMPSWAVAMQAAIMSHTSQAVDSLKTDVDEAKAMALEAQEGVRSLKKEISQMDLRVGVVQPTLLSAKMQSKHTMIYDMHDDRNDYRQQSDGF